VLTRGKKSELLHQSDVALIVVAVRPSVRIGKHIHRLVDVLLKAFAPALDLESALLESDFREDRMPDRVPADLHARAVERSHLCRGHRQVREFRPRSTTHFGLLLALAWAPAF